MAIELTLEVTDKGTATVNQVARNALSAFDRIRAGAVTMGHSITSAFTGGLASLGRLLESMFSFRGLLIAISGGGLLYLIGNAFQNIAERSTTLSDRFGRIKDALGSVIQKIVDYIGSNPDLLRALDNIAYKITDWAARLPEMEDWFRRIVSWVVTFADSGLSKVAEVFKKIYDFVVSIPAKIEELWKKLMGMIADVKKAMASVGSFFGGSATTNSSSETLPDEMAPSTYVGTQTSAWKRGIPDNPNAGNWRVTNIFNENIGRSDAVNIAIESARALYRDAPEGDYAPWPY